MNNRKAMMTCWPEDPAWPDQSDNDPYDVAS